MNVLTHGSTFSGIEGVGLGFDRAGMRTVAQVERDKTAQSVLRRHFPETLLLDDITKVRSDEYPRVDVLSGGFPCQDLSKAGSRRGLRGERSGLFYAFMDLVDLISPTWIVIENVVGLLSSDRGRDMGAVVRSMVERGYGVAWRTLDASGFGVPQKRKRVFIVGNLGDVRRAGAVLLERTGLQRNDRARAKDGKADARSATRGIGAGDPVLVRMRMGKPGGGKGPLVSTRSLTLATSNDQVLFVPGDRPRRLTPLEQERIQGFPDGWTELADDGSTISDTARAKLIGNSVSPKVSEWIGRRLVAVENGEDPDETV